MKNKKSKRVDFEMEDVGAVQFSPEMTEMIENAIDSAEAELEEAGTVEIHFRWQKESMNVVKSAAAAIGVSYQDYIKHVAYTQALDDLAKRQSVRDGL